MLQTFPLVACLVVSLRRNSEVSEEQKKRAATFLLLAKEVFTDSLLFTRCPRENGIVGHQRETSSEGVIRRRHQKALELEVSTPAASASLHPDPRKRVLRDHRGSTLRICAVPMDTARCEGSAADVKAVLVSSTFAGA